MKIFVVRHGESKTNCEGLWTGWMDVPLTEKGKTDAQRVQGLLKGIPFDRIYTSDLSRAKETAEIAIPGAVYESTPALREISVGSIAGKPLSVLSEEQKQIVRTEGYAIFGGETRMEFCERIAAFMRELEQLPFENVAVFAHAGFLRSFLSLVIGMQLPSAKICCKNCTVAVFECKDAFWKLCSWINIDDAPASSWGGAGSQTEQKGGC